MHSQVLRTCVMFQPSAVFQNFRAEDLLLLTEAGRPGYKLEIGLMRHYLHHLEVFQSPARRLANEILGAEVKYTSSLTRIPSKI